MELTFIGEKAQAWMDELAAYPKPETDEEAREIFRKVSTKIALEFPSPEFDDRPKKIKSKPKKKSKGFKELTK